MNKIYEQPQATITNLYDDVIRTSTYENVGNFNPDWLSGGETATDFTGATQQ